MSKELYKLYGEKNKNKIDYLLKLFNEEYLILMHEKINKGIDNMDLDNYIKIDSEFNDELKLAMELKFDYLSEYLNLTTHKELRKMVLKRDSLGICLIDKYINNELFEESIKNHINNNQMLKKFIDYNCINEEELEKIIKNQINNVDEIGYSKIEESILENIKEVLPEKENFFKQLKENKSYNIKDENMFNIIYNTSEVYKRDELVENLSLVDNNSIDYEKLDYLIPNTSFVNEIVYNEGFFKDLIDNIKNGEKYDLEKIYKFADKLDITKEEMNCIYMHELSREKAIDISFLEKIQIYKKYNTYNRNLEMISKDLENNITKEILEKNNGPKGIIDFRKIAIEVIFENMNFSKEQFEKMKTYIAYNENYQLSIYNLTQQDIDILRDNYETLSQEDSDMFKFFYIKNIENNPEIKETLKSLPKDLNDSIYKINRNSSSYEISNLIKLLEEKQMSNEENIDVLQNKKEEDKLKSEFLISKLSPEKKENLEDFVREMNFKEYEYDLGFPNHTTIGVELEFENISETLIKKILEHDNIYNKILANQNIDSNGENIFNSWDIKFDSSLKNGAEITSPILKDNKKDWENFKKICDTITFLGGKTNENCGGHIHIGTNILGTDSKAWENFFKIWESSEELIYKMSNKEGNHLRKDIVEYAVPTKNIINEILNKGSIKLENDEDVKNLAEYYSAMVTNEINNTRRNKGMNLDNIAKGTRDTIEIRIPNGELDPVEIQKNIKLYVKLLEVSKKMSIDEEYKKELFDNLTSNDEKEDKLYEFIDLVFDEKKDKAIYLSRYFNYKEELSLGDMSYKEAMDKKPILSEVCERGR